MLLSKRHRTIDFMIVQALYDADRSYLADAALSKIIYENQGKYAHGNALNGDRTSVKAIAGWRRCITTGMRNVEILRWRHAL